MTPEQYKKLPKYLREYIKEITWERDQANEKIEKLEACIKGMYPDGTNTFINTYPDKTPLPDSSEVLFTDGKVGFSVRFHKNDGLEIYENNFRGKEMLIKPLATNRIIIRSV